VITLIAIGSAIAGFAIGFAAARIALASISQKLLERAQALQGVSAYAAATMVASQLKEAEARQLLHQAEQAREEVRRLALSVALPVRAIDDGAVN